MENALTVERLEQMFSEAEETTHLARKEAERARDYYDGAQLTEAEREALRKRGQPEIVINRIRRKIDWLVGLEVKQRTDPKAFPRTPKHEQDAEAATDALRFIADNTDFDGKRSQVWENMLVEGFGGVEVVHRQTKKGAVEIDVNFYPWDRLFYDPYSRRADFTDARYLGAVIWMDKAEFVVKHPEARAIADQIAASESATETYDDSPRFGRWYDAGRQRIRVVLLWHKVGDEWQYCRFIKGHKLESGTSPYVDEEGDTVCPLILQGAYVSRNGERYGVVRDMFSPQDEVNKRRSKALHALNTRQTIATRGMIADEQAWRREVARPDALLIIEPSATPQDQVRIESNMDLASGQAQLLQEAKDEIDMMGANSALAGDTGESASGRAVLARQQGGMIEIAMMMDRLHQFTRRVYEHMWMRVRQFWTEERWVRVTDDDRNVRFVGLNRTVTLRERLSQMPEPQVLAIAKQLRLVPGDPRLNAPVGVENRVAEVEVDIILEEVPDRVTLQGEAFEALLRYAQTGAIPPAVLIEADPSLPASKKEKLLEMMQKAPPPPGDLAKMQKDEASAAKDAAQAQKYQAEAARMALPQPMMPAAGA